MANPDQIPPKNRKTKLRTGIAPDPITDSLSTSAQSLARLRDTVENVVTNSRRQPARLTAAPDELSQESCASVQHRAAAASFRHIRVSALLVKE